MNIRYIHITKNGEGVDINIGDVVEGIGVQKGTKVVGIEYTTSKVTLNLALKKKKVKATKFSPFNLYNNPN